MSDNKFVKIHDSDFKDADVLQSYYPRILDTVQVGIWILNDNLKTLYVNGCMAQLLDSTIEDIKQKSFTEYLSPAENEILNILNNPGGKIDGVSFVCRYKRRTGLGPMLEVTIVPLQNKNGRNYNILALHKEIPLEKTEEPYQNPREHLIIDSLKDYAVMTVDIDRIVLSWNTGASAIFGYNEDEIIGQCADILFTTEDIDNRVPESEINAALKIGHSYDDRWHVRKDGSKFYASGVMTRLSKDGEPPKLIKIARDWTERKKMEEMLKTADKHKNEFLATLAHELRNPLASILSGIEVLKQDKDKTIVFKTREIIERQVQQMIHLVNDLLDISRISLGKIKLKKEIINLVDAIHLALETSRPIIEGYKHALTVSLPPGPIIVNGDMTRLSQVFLNVLVNSAKYTPQKGKITLNVYPYNNDVIIKVTDNGMGIPAPMLSSIFEMFEQVQDRSEYPQAGLGIGLSVVKQLVQMHEGSVEAYSAGVNTGSTFTVRLPMVQDQEIGYQQNDNLSDVPIKKVVTPIKKKILLVDDNMDAADMMEVLLTKKGYLIKKAYNGKTGILAALDFNPDIVLLDLGLPDINGYDVLKSLKEKLGDKCYLALSGWGQHEDFQRSKEAGFDRHLVKPIDIQSLDEILQKVK